MYMYMCMCVCTSMYMLYMCVCTCIQVLAGDINEAICSHALHYSIWRRYGALPERFDWMRKSSAVAFYPLRPELVESTYLLYQVGVVLLICVTEQPACMYVSYSTPMDSQATKNPFYLHVGSDILASLEKHTKAR